MPAILATAYHSFVELERTGEQFVFPHGLARMLRVDTRGPEEEEFLHSYRMACTDEIELDAEIVGEKIDRFFIVGFDTADSGCRQDNDIGSVFVHPALDVRLTKEVYLSPFNSQDIARLAREAAHDG